MSASVAMDPDRSRSGSPLDDLVLDEITFDSSEHVLLEVVAE